MNLAENYYNKKNRNKKEFISYEYERELIKNYQLTKDKVYLDKIIESNISIIFKVINKFSRKNDDLYNDLFSEAILGIIKAVNKFDLKFENLRFNTYSIYWIKSYVYDYVSGNNIVGKTPSSSSTYRKILFNLNKTKQDLKILHDVLTDKDVKLISEKIKVSETDLINFINYNKSLSINTKVNTRINNEGIELEDIIEDKNNYFESFEINHDYKIMVESFDEILSKREKNILLKNICQDITLEELGKEYNVSRERIRQIKENALKKIRKKWN